MPPIVLEHLNLELFPIGEVAVVAENDAEWRIYIERLRLFLAGRTCGRIAALADTGIAQQRAHISSAEHIAHQAVGFVHAECLTIAGCNARSIMTAMLQQKQRIVKQLVDRTMGNDADYATHGGLLNNDEDLISNMPHKIARQKRCCGSRSRFRKRT